MADYIDKNDLREYISGYIKSCNGKPTYTDMDAMVGIIDLLEAMPAADVQPVKCGHWDYSEKENGECEWYFCSECDSPAEQLYTDEPLLSEFCPHCGADMRGEQNDRV